MIKKYILPFFWLCFTQVHQIFANQGLTGSDITSGLDLGNNGRLTTASNARFTIGNIMSWIKEEIFFVVPAIAIVALVWVGMRMAAARGKPEEFKKAWTHFVYIIVGVLLVFMALAIVQIVSRFSV